MSHFRVFPGIEFFCKPTIPCSRDQIVSTDHPLRMNRQVDGHTWVTIIIIIISDCGVDALPLQLKLLPLKSLLLTLLKLWDQWLVVYYLW